MSTLLVLPKDGVVLELMQQIGSMSMSAGTTSRTEDISSPSLRLKRVCKAGELAVPSTDRTEGPHHQVLPEKSHFTSDPLDPGHTKPDNFPDHESPCWRRPRVNISEGVGSGTSGPDIPLRPYVMRGL